MAKPETGVAEEIAPGVRRVLAPNPGPMTYWGTNSFILGEGEIAIVDPGPDSDAHLNALLKATKGEKITQILVTHSHSDHSPLSRNLSKISGAPILGFGPPEAGRSPTMQRLAASGSIGGGEGVDEQFRPDKRVTEGDVIEGAGWRADVLHTPGHFAGHISFAIGEFIVSGDHVMDWSSSLVSPPDGDLSAFMTTSTRLRDAGAAYLLPAHGNRIDTPEERLNWLIDHRKSRETAILNALSGKPQTLSQITARVYTDIDPKLLLAAERNVFAHLIDLTEKKLVAAEEEISVTSRFCTI